MLILDQSMNLTNKTALTLLILFTLFHTFITVFLIKMTKLVSSVSLHKIVDKSTLKNSKQQNKGLQKTNKVSSIKFNDKIKSITSNLLNLTNSNGKQKITRLLNRWHINIEITALALRLNYIQLSNSIRPYTLHSALLDRLHH